MATTRATPVEPSRLPLTRRRTYTGAALDRRKAWGHEWGAIIRAIAKGAK